MVTRKFGGSWNAVKQAAGLPINPAMAGQTWTEGDMLQALRVAAAVLGDQFGEAAYEAWRDRNRPSIETIRMRFGSLRTAKAKLNLPAYDPGPPPGYTDADWRQAVLDFVREQCTAAAYSAWARTHGAPSLSILQKRAGGYAEALNNVWQWIRWDEHAADSNEETRS